MCISISNTADLTVMHAVKGPFHRVCKYMCIFLELHLSWHMEVPRLGVESELLLPAYTTATAMPDPSHICDLHHSSGQWWILNPLSEARIKPATSWFLARFVSTAPWRELLRASISDSLLTPWWESLSSLLQTTWLNILFFPAPLQAVFSDHPVSRPQFSVIFL